MHPAHGLQPLGGNDATVLQITLTPAAVACGEVDEARRDLFIGALELGDHADAPAGAAHQRGLDEIVAEDLSTERRQSR